MRAKEIMSQPVHTCRPDDTLNAAAQLMWEGNCGAIPVVDRAGRLLGIITDRDICMAAYTQGIPLAAIRVESAMIRQVFSVRPEDSVFEAARLMHEHKVRRLPVLNGEGKPVGIVSLNDLTRAAERSGRVKDGVTKVLHNLANRWQSRRRKARAA